MANYFRKVSGLCYTMNLILMILTLFLLTTGRKCESDTNFIDNWCIGVVVYLVVCMILDMHIIAASYWHSLKLVSRYTKGVRIFIIFANYVYSWVLLGYAIHFSNNELARLQGTDIDCASKYGIFEVIYITLLVHHAVTLTLYVCIFCCICTMACVRREPGERPVDESVLLQNTIVKNFSEWLGIDNSCPICMEDYAETDPITKLNCGHYFHQACINEWLKKSSLCPYCRHKVDEPLVSPNAQESAALENTPSDTAYAIASST